MRVLMFGWEFSPFQAGGLATATLGLVKGLLNRGTEVTLVVPFSLSAASDVPNLRLVSAADPRPALRSIRVDSPLAPYAGAEEYQVLSEQGAKGTRGGAVYGANLFEEVERYALIAEEIAREEPHDLIDTRDWITFEAGRRARAVSGKPLVAHIHANSAILVEGAERVLGWRSPNYVYESASAPGLRLLPRNYRITDDVGFRFSNRDWDGWPLTADRWTDWISRSAESSVHVFMDYETFGEHQWAETGIFEFLRQLPDALARRNIACVHPSTLAARAPAGSLSFPVATSWADVERDTSAWLGNRMQRAAFERLYRLGPDLKALGDPVRLGAWRRLTTSDHCYYMCTKWFADGDVHKYFNPHESPYDAFVAFMNALTDLERRCAAERPSRPWVLDGEMAVAG